MTLRCLLVSPVLPAPPVDGGRLRVFHLARGLAERHAVDVLALAEAGAATQEAQAALAAHGVGLRVVPHAPRRASTAWHALRRRCSYHSAVTWSPELARQLRACAASGSYDVVQFEYAYLGRYLRAWAGPRPALVLDEHNVEFRLAETLAAGRAGAASAPYRAYARREVALRRREELAACRAADAVVTVSPADRDLLRRHLPDLDVTVAPNGVDLEAYRPLPVGGEPPGAVFVGKMDYRPNVDAVEWFCREILPTVRQRVPGYRFTIVGGPLARPVRALATRPGVETTGQVLDTRPYLARAQAVVVPLRAGSGTRLKILEAMAAGRPVVSTTVGAEGLAVTGDHDIAIADTADELVHVLVALAGDERRRARLGANGRALVQARYGWGTSVDAVDALWRSLATARAAGGPACRR